MEKKAINSPIIAAEIQAVENEVAVPLFIPSRAAINRTLNHQ